LKHQLLTILQQSVDAVLADAAAPPQLLQEIQLEAPRNPAHGDFSTNVALVLAKRVNMAPRDLAAAIVEKLNTNELLERVETAGPGFINLHIATSAFMAVIGQVIDSGRSYGRSNRGNDARVQLEFVSANPTGPLHVGHGRGAAYGAVLANVLTATGYRVEKEYYVNDAGRQMDILAVSVLLRYLQAGGAVIALPENAYQGDYIVALAEDLRRRDGDAYTCEAGGLAVVADGDAETALDGVIANSKAILGGTRYASLHRFARDEILAGIKTDLAHFGVTFDNWFSESSLSEDDQIANSLAALTASGTIYSEGGARWFRSTAYGDEKDRVVVRDNGNATYFASDIAYHANKYRRGYDHLINIWGADHHGYISRVKAAIAALGHEPEQLEVLLVQFAALYRHGERWRCRPVPASS
jgi:arginyl-tRNA synthetase